MSQITVPDYDDLFLSGLRVRSPAQVNRSVWTGSRKVIGMAGAEVWIAQAVIDTQATELAERPWRAFLFGLRGQVNFFRWYLPRSNHIGPKPTVDAGAVAGAYTLPLRSMAPSTLVLQAGQFMTVPMPSGKYRTVCLTADLVSDSSGDATATFEPALNEAAAEGATVETADPFIDFALVEPEQGFDYQDGISGAAFDVEEYR